MAQRPMGHQSQQEGPSLAGREGATTSSSAGDTYDEGCRIQSQERHGQALGGRGQAFTAQWGWEGTATGPQGHKAAPGKAQP